MHTQSSVKKADEEKLPDELAIALAPQLRHALEHPLRREILRVLHQDVDRPQSIEGIASHLTDLSVGQARYHARVLEQPEAIVVAEVLPSPDGDLPLYVSAVAEDSGVLAALRATQQHDRNRRCGVDRRSPGLLTMFRVPRPTITIRLGRRRRED
jgi:DNA-binding transcriptional ArsR family regulator